MPARSPGPGTDDSHAKTHSSASTGQPLPPPVSWSCEDEMKTEKQWAKTVLSCAGIHSGAPPPHQQHPGQGGFQRPVRMSRAAKRMAGPAALLPTCFWLFEVQAGCASTRGSAARALHPHAAPPPPWAGPRTPAPAGSRLCTCAGHSRPGAMPANWPSARRSGAPLSAHRCAPRAARRRPTRPAAAGRPACGAPGTPVSAGRR